MNHRYAGVADAALRAVFEEEGCGPVVAMRRQASRGIAYLEFEDAAAAYRALELSGTRLHGRPNTFLIEHAFWR